MAIHFLLLRKLMRNEPSILFSMKQTMFFVPKEQLGALSSWNEVKKHFVLFILSLFSIDSMCVDGFDIFFEVILC